MRYSVIVCGGGLSGVCAAIAAAREGKRVLLLEKYGVLGGAALHALVNPFMPYRTKGHRVNNAGLFQAILDGLAGMGGLFDNQSGFNEQLLTLLLDQMVAGCGVEVLFHSQMLSAEVTEGRITSVEALGVSGERMIFSADMFIDATGDAELTHLCGCPYAVGREEDGRCQPMTTCFRVGRVDKARLEAAAKGEGKSVRAYMTDLYCQAKLEGRVTNPREDMLFFPHSLPDAMHFNTTRVTSMSSLDTASFTRAELEGRRQVLEMFTFMKQSVRGFEDSVLLQVAPQIGVRESRRLQGAYVLTREDVIGCVKFEDAIARACYDIDVHNPAGTGTTILRLPEGEYYTIPLRCLYHPGYPNLLVAGRPISSDHVAHSSLRVMPICASIGEAAGIAAALAGPGGVAAVSPRDVQSLLTRHGAVY